MSASERRHKLLTDPPKRLVITMGLPLVISFLLATLFNLVDTFFVSMLPEQEAIDGMAGIGNAFVIQMVLIAIGSGIGQGAASTIARLLGAGKRDDAVAAAAQVLLMTISLTAVFMCAGVLVRPLMAMTAVGDGAIEAATIYGEYIAIGCVGWFIPMIAGGILRGTGDMIAPMLAMLSAIILNLILDPILIFGVEALGIPAMGVRGAAAATVAARWASALLVLYFLVGPRNTLGRGIFRIVPNGALLRDVLRVGIPTSIGTILGAGYYLVVQIFVGRIGGTDAQAAFMLGFRFEQLAWLPAHGIAIALTTVVGQNHGAGQHDRVREAFRWCLIWTTGFIGLFSLFYLVAAPWLAAMFVTGEVHAMTTYYLRVVAVELPLLAVAMTIGSTFNGRGRGWPYFTLNVLRLFVIAIPLFILFEPLGLEAFWWAMPLASGLAVVIGMVWIRHDLSRDLQPAVATSPDTSPDVAPKASAAPSGPE